MRALISQGDPTFAWCEAFPGGYENYSDRADHVAPSASENIDGAQDELLIRGRNGRRREVDRSPAVALAAIEAL